MSLSSIDILFYLVSNLFRIYVFLKFIEFFFNNQSNYTKIKFSIFIIFYLLNSSLHLVFSNPIVNLLSNIFFAYIFTSIYKSKLWLKICSIFLVYSINMLLDQLTYDLLLSIDLQNHIYIYTSIISSILMYMFILILNRIFRKKYMATLTLMQCIVIFTIPLSSIAILITLFWLDCNYLATLIMSSVLFLMNIIVFYFHDILVQFYFNQKEKELLERQNLAYFNEFKLIKASDNNLRQLKHDYKNHILAMQKLLKLNQIVTLEKYLCDLYQFTESKSQYVTSSNEHVNSILNYKLQEAVKLGSIINCNITIPDILNISAFYLNIVLGNLLDNALEALQKSANKKLSIDIQLEKNFLYIDISNSYSGTIKTAKSKILTTKLNTSEHGLGLESVKSVVDKYDGIMDISYNENTFSVNLAICNALI